MAQRGKGLGVALDKNFSEQIIRNFQHTII